MADAAAYRCELGSNQRLYLSNEGPVTTLTLLSSGSGQQQQSSNRFSTGEWTAEPTLYRLGQGMLVVISADSTTYYLQIQGGQAQVLSGPLSSQVAEQIERSQPVAMQREEDAGDTTILDSPMQPMTPMTPMKPMRMNQNPMSMSMGNMEMTMGETGMGKMKLGDMTLGNKTPSAQSESAESSPTEAAKVKRFCSQCGAAVAGDSPAERLRHRFCAYCGTSLT